MQKQRAVKRRDHTTVNGIQPSYRRLVTPAFYSVESNFENCLGKGLWGFLRQIVPNATLDSPVLVLACEFLGVGTRLWVRRSIGITLYGDGRHRDDERFRKSFVDLIVLGLASGQADSPATIVDRDSDLIRIIE